MEDKFCSVAYIGINSYEVIQLLASRNLVTRPLPLANHNVKHRRGYITIVHAV